MDIKEFARRLASGLVRPRQVVADSSKVRTSWVIEKYDAQGRLYAREEIRGNLLLNEGITELLTLLIGGSATPFNNTNARIGVGDGTVAASATQTDLQGTNKAFKGMDTGYPQVSGQTVTFKATFGPTEANFSWKEFTVVNGADDTAKNLNRKVEDHGTKASGDTWSITVQITIS
ncbi:MAG: hypothetical protein ACPLRW_07160 [Moorellales bacterium]